MRLSDDEDDMADPQVEAIKQQAQQAIQQLQQALQQAEQKANDKMGAIQAKMHKTDADNQIAREAMFMDHMEKQQALKVQYDMKMADIDAKMQMQVDKINASLMEQKNQMMHEFNLKMTELAKIIPMNPPETQPMQVHINMPNGKKTITNAEGKVLGTMATE